ncbi:hypothetical protein [Larkinella soli]|uniref:hypothetical protein n=1 Tax=Larkinella soli TaxID=1770527 RepID=UPI000FFB6B7A|nr:hypothetical protein [Larkinella soli]
MTAFWTVPEKVLVRQFYLQNTGLFMVVLLVGFGFLSSVEHIALATYALHDLPFLGLYVGLWVVYTAYVVRFSLYRFQTTDLLQLMRLVAPGRRVLILYGLHVQLLLPVIAYAGFMGWLGVQQHTVKANNLLILSVALLSAVPVPCVEWALRHPNPERFSGRIGSRLRQRLATPYVLFFIRYLLHRQPVTLLLAKGGSGLLTLGVLALYPTDDYDLRLLLLGALLSAAFHASIVYELYQFEATQLLLVRNLPWPTGRRFLFYALIFTLLLSPELLLMVRNRPAGVSLPAQLSVWLFALGSLLLPFAGLQVRHRPRDRFTAVIFWQVILSFFLIMYRLPAWLLGVSALAAAAALFVYGYYRSSWEADEG